MKTSFVQTLQRRSPLKDTQNLSGGSKKKSLFSRDLAMALPLTSLIDAFSIIVIYLLVGTQSGGMETQIPNKMNLPLADHSIGIIEETPILKIEKGVYYLDDKIVRKNELSEKLSELKKSSVQKTAALMIQADQEMNYEELDPLLRASSEAGIEKMKFAVVPTK